MNRRVRVLSLAVLAGWVLPGLAMADEVNLETNRFYEFGGPPGVHDDHNLRSFNIVGSFNLPYASATVTGNPYSETGSTITFSAAIPDAPEGAHSTTNDAQFELGLNSFAFYPARAGALGDIIISGTATDAGIRYSNGSFERTLADPPALLRPAQFILKIGGGQFNVQKEGYKGSASVSLRFEPNATVTRRLHWDANDRGSGLTFPPAETGVATNWLERTTPNQDFVAVFGKFTTIQNPKLSSNTTWLGIVSDAFGHPALDLDGHTLTLKKANLVEDNFSISIGEEKFGSSSMSVANGIVNADSNLLIETRTATQADGTTANFGVQPNTTVNLDGIVSMSKFANTNSALAVVGENAKLNALGLIAGNNGGAIVFIEQGGQVTLEQNFQIAQGSFNNNAQVQVVGAGSSLTIGGPSLGATVVKIGDVAKGTLAVTNGASVNFNSSQVDIGSPIGASGSIISVKGANSQLLGGTYNIGTVATLEILDGAKLLSNAASGISLATEGTFTADNGATVNVGNLFVSGNSSKAAITRGSNVTVSNEIRIRPTTTLTVSTGSTLTGFNDALITGNLLIGPGAVVTGDEITIGDNGLIVIGSGFMQVNKITANSGKIIVDAGQFISITPPPEEPPGDVALRAPASLNATANLGSTLNITGELILGPAASLELHAFSPTDIDTAHITGNATLDGTLLLNFSTFAPQTGDIFNFLTVTGTLTGLTNIQILGLEPNWQFSTAINAGTLQLTSLSNAVLAVPEPAAAIWTLLILPALSRRRR